MLDDVIFLNLALAWILTAAYMHAVSVRERKKWQELITTQASLLAESLDWHASLLDQRDCGCDDLHACSLEKLESHVAEIQTVLNGD